MKKVICFCLLISLFVSCSHNKEYIKHNSQESKKVVILIYGLPSCGKLTVAKELSKKYDLNLMDNHFFNNILFPYIVLNNKNVVAMDPEIVKIRKIWMDNIVKYGKKDKGFVFTDVLIKSKEREKEIKDMKEFAKKMNFDFLPVKLVCEEGEIKSRINSEERKRRHKLVDYNVWKEYTNNTKFLDIDGALVINNHNSVETAKIIGKKLK